MTGSTVLRRPDPGQPVLVGGLPPGGVPRQRCAGSLVVEPMIKQTCLVGRGE